MTEGLALDLTALGLGAIIGSALSYAELASTIPASGSAYTCSCPTLGELAAWVIVPVRESARVSPSSRSTSGWRVCWHRRSIRDAYRSTSL